MYEFLLHIVHIQRAFDLMLVQVLAIEEGGMPDMIDQ
jgi:hypothetical protein